MSVVQKTGHMTILLAKGENNDRHEDTIPAIIICGI